MTENKQAFTHISVNDGSDDDVIIQAGAPASSVSRVATHKPVEAFDETEERVFVDEDGDVLEDAVDDYGEDGDVADEDDETFEVVDDNQATEASVDQHSSGASSRKKDTYHETTLEDLQDTSMSGTQKVVIGVVLGILVVAIIYFTFFLK